MQKVFKTFPALTRLRLSLVIAFSAIVGYVCAGHEISWKLTIVFVGVALLSAGASAFNQVQEKDLDARMERTQDRPLPTGKWSVRQALYIAILLSTSGFFLLVFWTNFLAAMLGAFTLVWYCGIYTPLKRKTLFALPVGALTGALAPLIGCAAAIGHIQISAIGIGLFLLFWQVPHFLIMLLKYGHQYQNAGFPYLSMLNDLPRFKRIVFVWIVAASVTTLVFPLFYIVSTALLIIVLILINILFLAYTAGWALRGVYAQRYKGMFRVLYLYQAAVLGIVVAQGLTIYP